MIELLTGLPGSGKTLRVVGRIKQFLADGRPVFVCSPKPKDNGPEGLRALTLPVTFWDERNERSPHDWEDLPNGAVLVVDEAQEWFRTRRTGLAPESVLAMEKHRHRGIDFLLTTQQPTYLDKHLRGLVGKHEHLVRNFQHESSNVFEFRECYDDVQDTRLRDRASYSLWRFPKEDYALYQSAEVHTVKAKLPLKMKLYIVAGVVALGLFGFVGWKAYATWGTDAAPSARPSAGSPAPDGRGGIGLRQMFGDRSATSGGRRSYANAGELAEDILPRVPELPWSAPIFDGRRAQSDPEVFCMASGAGQDGSGKHREASCTCLSEQGTRYYLPEASCRMIAKNGQAYNPFRRAERDTQRQGAAPVAQGGGYAPTGDALPSVTISADQVSGYGGIGVGQADSAP